MSSSSKKRRLNPTDSDSNPAKRFKKNQRNELEEKKISETNFTKLTPWTPAGYFKARIIYKSALKDLNEKKIFFYYHD